MLHNILETLLSLVIILSAGACVYAIFRLFKDGGTEKIVPGLKREALVLGGFLDLAFSFGIGYFIAKYMPGPGGFSPEVLGLIMCLLNLSRRTTKLKEKNNDQKAGKGMP